MTHAVDDTTSHDDSSPLHRSWWGIAAKLILAAGVMFAVYLIWQTWIEPHEAGIEKTLANLGPWGPVIFIVAFLIGTSLFFPESVLAIAAGTINKATTSRPTTSIADTVTIATTVVSR